MSRERDHPQLAEQLAELAALTGGLAHEIRNPLSTLKVNLQLLDEDWRRVESPEANASIDPQEIARRSRKRIETLLKEAGRLEQILQDFLQYIGRRDHSPAPHDLNAVVGELADFYRPQAQAGAIEMRVEPAPGPVMAMVDVNGIKQTLLNLLINGQQAMPDGGALTLRVCAEPGGTARIDVIDTGPGIPPDQREQVFQAYYSTKKGGTGLGLATARRIVREHGGEIRLTSSPGKGACFSILLPVLS
ncbi:MAG: two-component sensor histidine kinase [Planctomycetota bacterium]|nr:MAG: two-component sensor histidine kinase [Planctomycetota bacterium]